MSEPRAEPGIGRASAFLASGTVVSRVLGFVKAIVLAQTIGVTTGQAGDAFAVANQLPNTVYLIIAGGVLSAVLVPQIVRAAAHADGGAAYINKLLTIALVILGGATVIAVLGAPVLTFVVASGWSGPQLALATAFAYWCLPQIFFYGLYTVLGEILNARKLFGPFTWAPVLNNVVAIIGLVVFAAIFGTAADGVTPPVDWTPVMIGLLGGTATLGVAAQALILFVFWRRVGLGYRPDFHWRGVGLRDAGRMASWTFGMLVLTTIAGLVETNVASRFAEGASIFALQNAWLIFMLPHSVITVSIATAYFTRMSEKGQRGDLHLLRADVTSAIRIISVIIVLAAAGLIVVAFPFASLFTQDFAGTRAMGLVIIGFVIGLVPFCVLFVIQRAFYALGDTKTPFFFTLFQAILFSVGAVFVGILVPGEAVAAGIAVMMSIAGTLQCLLAGYLLRRRLGGLELAGMSASLLRDALAAGVAVVAGVLVMMLFGGAQAEGFATTSAFGAIMSMVATGAAMSLVYVIGLAAVRSPELGSSVRVLTDRLGKR